MQKLPLAYYQNRDVLFLAKDLLGKVLCTCINGELTSGIIVETEAYGGVGDKASHAYKGRRTARTEIIYHEGGVAYVYLCYGIHHFINVVTSVKDEPLAHKGYRAFGGHPCNGTPPGHAGYQARYFIGAGLNGKSTGHRPFA